MDELDKQYKRNIEKRKPFKASLKNEIDKLFLKYGNFSKDLLIKDLAKSNISVTFRTSDQGQLYGVTFIDHQNKTIFNGSDLGKAYSAKALSERFEKAEFNSLKLEATKPVFQPQQDNTSKSYLKVPEPTNFLGIALAKSQSESGIAIPKRRKKRQKGKTIEQNQQLTL